MKPKVLAGGPHDVRHRTITHVLMQIYKNSVHHS